MRKAILCTILLGLLIVHSYGYAVTFEPAPLPGGQRALGGWSEDGYRFSTPTGVASNDTNTERYPFNGTTYLQLLTRDTPLQIVRLDGAPFSITSIDLAEYSTLFAVPKTILFQGNKTTGEIVTVSFRIDGVIDGNGPLTDFQTFAFPHDFTGLKSVTTTASPFSFDNVRVAIVPEPGSTILLALSFVTIAGTRRRRKA